MSILPRLGYTHAENVAIIATLCDNCETKVRAELHTRSGDFAQDISVFVKGGQVDVDSSGRRCQVSLFDKDHVINLVDEAIYLRRNLAVWLGVYVPAETLETTQGWYWIPVFAGPIVVADPAGAWIQVEAHGKASLCLNSLREAKTLPKGHLITNLVTTVLHDWSGLSVSSLTLPTLKKTLPADKHVPAGAQPWHIAQQLAESVNMDLEFDGAGKTLMREVQTSGDPQFTYYDRNDFGKPVSVVTDPSRTQKLTDDQGLPLPNWVLVNGRKASHGQAAISAGWDADPASPISAQTLAINDVPQFFRKVVNNEHIKTEEAALAIAKAQILIAEQASQQITFEAMPLWFFDHMDRQRVQVSNFVMDFNLSAFSFSLGGSDDSPTMTVGYTARRSWAGPRKRRR